MPARPYQTAALEAVRNRKVPRGVVAIPTGTGKGYITRYLHEALGTDRILYLAHRKELIKQLYHHVSQGMTIMSVEIEQAAVRSTGSAPCVVASVDTLVAGDCKRLDRINPESFDAVVVDECHHSTAPKYVSIWQRFGLLDDLKKKTPSPRVSLIGLTATPSRGDGVGLSNVFDDILYQMSLQTAIKDGWLVPVYAYTVQTGTDLNDVKTSMGDYKEGELAKAVNVDERNEAIFDAYHQNAAGLKTLIFAVTVQHAEDIAATFCAHGVEARTVDGTMKDWQRDATFDWFAHTPGAVLCNCALVTEGVDIPSVECVIMARPTKSATLYAQCMGRGTRLAAGAANYAESCALGKDRMILLDITDCISDTGKRAVTPGDLFGAPFPRKPLKGKEMLEEVEEQQQEIKLSFSPTRVATTSQYVDLFAGPVKVQGVHMTWVDTGGVLMLRIPKQGVFSVESDLMGRYTCVFKQSRDAGGETRGGEKIHPSAKEAMIAAESWARTQFANELRLIDRTAKWRRDPPSDAQLEQCKKFRIPVPAGASKGDVSTALDRFFSGHGRVASARR